MRRVDRSDGSDLVGITVIGKISGFQTAFGMCKYIYFLGAGLFKDLIYGLGNKLSVPLDGADGILFAEEDPCPA